MAAKEEGHLTLMELSMFALGGIKCPQAMKLHGKSGDSEVVVMVDSCASHCFINERAISHLQFPMAFTGKFGVRLGDDSRPVSRGVFLVVMVELRPTQVQIDCYVFPLGTVDIILG